MSRAEKLIAAAMAGNTVAARIAISIIGRASISSLTDSEFEAIAFVTAAREKKTEVIVTTAREKNAVPTLGNLEIRK